MSAVTGMINIYPDAPKLFDRVTPYVGGGVGVSRNHVGETDAVFAGVPATVDSGTNTSFAWQVSAGFAVDLAPDWLLELGYRYVDLGKIETGDNFTIAGATVPGARSTGNLSAHEIQLGIRDQF